MKNYDFTCPECGQFVEWSYSTVCGPCAGKALEAKFAAQQKDFEERQMYMASAWASTCLICGAPPLSVECITGTTMYEARGFKCQCWRESERAGSGY